jgi:hypothetical protein
LAQQLLVYNVIGGYMKKTIFFIFATSLMTTFFFQNCSKKKFTLDTTEPTKPITPSTYVGGNSKIKIIIHEYPKDAVKSSDSQFVDFEVIAIDSKLKNVECALDQVAVACDAVDRVELKNLSLGNHTFEIFGENVDGDTGTEVITWAIYNKLIAKTKDININSVRTADIIINVDNSYSMADIQQNMASRVSKLLDKIKTLDSYNLSVITTEPYSSIPSHATHVDGLLGQFDDGTYCLTKSNATSNRLGKLVQRNESLTYETSGNGYERGIYTTRRAFEHYPNTSSKHSKCLRPNVPKHVILISDENESKYLEDSKGDPITTSPLSYFEKSSAQGLISLAANTFGSSSFKFHSIIINPYTSEGQNCLKQKQAFSPNSKYGTDYAQLSQKTGGVIGSVCASDYSSQLSVIGDSIVKPEKVYGLDCVAIQLNGSWGHVKRLSNDQYVSSYKVEGSNVEFTADLPNDTYRVTYFCYE